MIVSCIDTIYNLFTKIFAKSIDKILLMCYYISVLNGNNENTEETEMKNINTAYEIWKKEKVRLQAEEMAKIRAARYEEERRNRAEAINKRRNEAKRAIMKRAWEIANDAAIKFGGKASEYISESMKISWVMAKIENKKDEVFMLNMKDINGGANNIVAQNQIRTNREAIAKIENEIANLKKSIDAA